MKKIMFAVITVLLFLSGNLYADTFEEMDLDHRCYFIGPRGGRYYINANGKKTYSVKGELKDKMLDNKIYTGPHGGRYYVNRNGNKTYVSRKQGGYYNYSCKSSSTKRSRSYSCKSSSTKRSRSYSTGNSRNRRNC